MAQAIELPETLDAAHALIIEQASFIKELRSENADLKHRLDQHARRLFGKKSEHLDAAQLELAFAALNAAESTETDAADEIVVPAHKRRKKGHGRTKFSDDIPRERRVILPESTTCPCCSKPMSKIGEETSEQLDYVPASLKVIETVRPKYACGQCKQGVHVALAPKGPITKGKATASTLAHVTVSKYVDHLPLTRQVSILARQGVRISKQTLCGWIRQVSELLAPIERAMWDSILDSRVLMADETPVKVLVPGKKETKRAYLWAYLGYYRPATKAPVQEEIRCDVLVYGGTPAGVTAAVQAARMGKSVMLLSNNRHVGGMTSGGLTATDIGNRAAIGGMAMEFYQGLGQIKDFLPSEAETLFLKMLAEQKVEVRFERWLEGVTMDQGRIVSAKMESGETIHAAMFIDATYEGDLFAAAGVSHHVGREPEGAYDESLAGKWKAGGYTHVYQFCDLPISPFVDPANPESGLLPEISAEDPGEHGEGDFKVQAYNFRMFLTNAEGKIPFPKPTAYDPGRYALLARFLNADPRIRWTLNYTKAHLTDGPVQMRNGDSNNAGSFSSDYVGGSHRWPDGTYDPKSFSVLPPPRTGLPVSLSELYQIRETIFQEHIRYQQGLMYFLAHDPQVPKALQERVRRFGLDPREFKETGHWPHHLYIREGRRMLSSYVMTQADCESKRVASDSVGLAAYMMDSHNCERLVVLRDGLPVVRNDGNLGEDCPKPYPISYRSIVPKQEECTNLLVPVCLSASHVAYGSIRMEPVFMILGQSAGTAAAMAIQDGLTVQEVDYDSLKARLLADGQKLSL